MHALSCKSAMMRHSSVQQQYRASSVDASAVAVARLPRLALLHRRRVALLAPCRSAAPGDNVREAAEWVARWRAQQQQEEASSDSNSSSSNGVVPASSAAAAPPQQQRRGGLAGLWDALPQQTQLTVIGVGFIVAMIGLPFLQPTSIYGDGGAAAAKAGGGAAIAQEKQQQPPKAPSKPIPVITPALEALQRYSMPRTLPDGRTESPGVLRIYLASMVILAAFYAASAALQVRPLACVVCAVLCQLCVVPCCAALFFHIVQH